MICGLLLAAFCWQLVWQGPIYACSQDEPWPPQKPFTWLQQRLYIMRKCMHAHSWITYSSEEWQTSFHAVTVCKLWTHRRSQRADAAADLLGTESPSAGSMAPDTAAFVVHQGRLDGSQRTMWTGEPVTLFYSRVYITFTEANHIRFFGYWTAKTVVQLEMHR